MALFNGRSNNLRNARKHAPLGLCMVVEPGADEEGSDGERHEGGGDREPDHPADFVLDVDHNGLGGQDDHGESVVVPVEEAVDPLPSLLRHRVELINAEGDAARPDPAAAYGQKGEAEEQHAELSLTRAFAKARVKLLLGALWWVKLW